ncbi:MAG: hypothetical protein AAF985_22125 [Bacteroidota bacterium]
MDSKINLLFVGAPDLCHPQQDSHPSLINRDIESKQFDHPIQAINYLRQCSPQQFPSAILAEVDLPLINGLEFAEIYLFEFYLQHPKTALYLQCENPDLTQQDELADNPAINEILPNSIVPEKIINKMANFNIQAVPC